jgi:hypothetical protein
LAGTVVEVVIYGGDGDEHVGAVTVDKEKEGAGHGGGDSVMGVSCP